MTLPGTSFFLSLDHHQDADRQQFDPRRTGLDHLALAASSAEQVHAWARHLDALGIDHDPVLQSSEPMPLAMVLFRDPDGIVIELIWTGA